MLNKQINRLIVMVLCVAFIMLPMVSCKKGGDEEETLPASYGTYGADFAREFAKKYPYRKAFSEQEADAGKYISDEITKLGFTCETQNFDTEKGSSSNYIVRIPGKGFYLEDASGNYEVGARTVVIGAHYDSAFAASEVDEEHTYDGISDNASGVATLMTVLSQFKEYNETGYNVIVVFFGAGNADNAGSKAFYESLSAADKASLEAMYCVDSIYAGDKIYVSSGRNSLISSQKYHMRKKIYQCYDIAYEYELYSKNGFNLLYNESGVIADINGDETPDIYREISANDSDYIVFDNNNIPCVYFDSFDYNFDTVEEMHDTKNLTLQEYEGKIRSTLLDSTTVLDAVLKTEEQDLLEVRVNNVAFIILESLLNSPTDGMNEKEYLEYKEQLEREAEAAATATSNTEN